MLAVATAPATAAPGNSNTDSPGFQRAQEALDGLGDRLPLVARENGMTTAQLRSLLLSDLSLAVDANGELAYFDAIAPGEVDTTGEAVASAPPVTGPEFELSSLPGADKTIYLDFDGHVTQGTSWNNAYNLDTIESPAYDLDGDPNSWSAQELSNIRRSFEIVAEDFAPWNVNVTTIDPGVEALRRSGSGDTQWGARVVITDDTFANCGCGGHAYIGAFDDVTDEPTFVYNSSLKGVAEAITHEVGHMLSLAHDGTSSVSYYQGHGGEGSTGWAPIMGAAYYHPVAQWSQQEFLNANNNGPDANYGNGGDDIAIISSLTNGNGFGLRADDVGDTAGTATALVGSNPVVEGLISTRTDVDVFSFSTSGGEVSFTATPAAESANLDIELTLRDSQGQIVAVANPTGELSASLTTTVSAGAYLVELDGVGVGNPFTDPLSGYTDYGSLGQYTLRGIIVNDTTPPPPDTDAPAVPAGLNASLNDGTVNLSWEANTEADLAGYLIYRTHSAETTLIGTASATNNFFQDTPPTSGDYTYSIEAEDLTGNRSARSTPVSVSIEVSLTSIATSDFAVSGAVQGNYTNTQTADGVTQVITESESGGKPSRRYDTFEHQWAFPATGVSQTLTVVARVVDGGDADNGARFEWSTDQSSWAPLGTILPGATVTESFAIGSPTGTVWIRVVDTNSRAGERSFDQVEIDLLRLDGEEVGDATEVLVSSFTSGTISAGKGQSRGIATVILTNDLGQPVADATVILGFTGDYTETATATTDANGVASVTTIGTAKRPSFEVCVISIGDTSLPYNGSGACRGN